MGYCERKVREDWKNYREALKTGHQVNYWRDIVRFDVSELRLARRAYNEF